MKTRLLTFTALALLVGALAGCGKSTTTLGPNLDNGVNVEAQAQVSAAIAANAGYIDEDAFSTSAEADVNAGAGVGLSAIRPLHFWRTITSVDRRIEIRYGDPDSLGRPTTAVATIHKHLLGQFNIAAGSIDVTDTTRILIHKPLDDRWVRRLALRRVGIDSTGTHQSWRVVGVSGVEVKSKDATTNILSLRIQAGTVDTTVTNPLELHRLRHMLLVSDSQTMHLTVTTGRNDDVVVLYRHLSRTPFVNNGDGTYTSEFVLGDFTGLRHVGVNAFTHGTLFDDTAAYDSNAWILGFVVRPGDDHLGEN
ncbi:MAG: hypothetical protein ABIU54_08925 [Candidatus Eisenbacteria bacterium]